MLADQKNINRLLSRCNLDSAYVNLRRPLFLITICALLFSVTNFVPFSAVLVVFIGLSPIFLLQKQQLSSAWFYSALMLLWFLLDTLIYDPNALTRFDFFRRDGNVFISFAPLILLGIMKLRINPLKTVQIFILSSAAITFVLALAWKLHLLTYETIDFHLLFRAHNAAGGFLSTTCCFTVPLVLRKSKKRWVWGLCLSALLLGLLLTKSRGSILGFIAVSGMFICPKGFLRSTFVACIILAHIALVGWGYQTVRAMGEVTKNQLVQLEAPKKFSRSWTVIDRLFLMWPKALHHFELSPLIGTGFGSYNDGIFKYGRLGTAAPLIMRPMDQPSFAFEDSDGHAHHTFLHVLAETGLLGFSLLVLCIWGLDLTARHIPWLPIGIGLRMAVWNAVFSSLTEHRFFTPSQMLPLMILFGLCLAARNALPQEKIKKEFLHG